VDEFWRIKSNDTTALHETDGDSERDRGGSPDI
jgi:hypothetical protein